MSAQEPPELPPMVARPSGSLVSLTLYLLFDQRQHFVLDELGVAAGHGVVFQAALAALGVAAAVADGDGDHDRDTLCSAMRLSRAVKSSAVGSVGADDEGRGGAGHVLFGDVDGDVAGVGRGMAGGDDELGGIGGIGGAEGVGVAGDAGIDLAVGRAHGELEDCSLRHAFLHGHLRRGVVGGAEDEVAVGVGGGVGAVGQFFGGDVAGGVGVAGGRRWAGWVWGWS